jgi:hypothetical protein
MTSPDSKIRLFARMILHDVDEKVSKSEISVELDIGGAFI